MNRINSYREVDDLPRGALTVKEYSDFVGISVAHVYKLWRLHMQEDRDIGFEIILFKGYNWIVGS